MNIIEFEAEVTKRYLTEPAFHARVQLAAEATAATMRRSTGMSMSKDFADAVIQACAYGLAVADIDVTANLNEELIAKMRATADALGGFQLIAAEEQ